LRGLQAGILVLAGVGLGWPASAAAAKEDPLTAIEVYDGPSGAAYAQLSDVLINGKAEMRDCTSFEATPIDKPTYSQMGKVLLAAGGVLERGQDGVMRYSFAGQQPVCVVPANAKLEHGATYMASVLANLAILSANQSGSTSAAPQIVKGVKLIFVSAPNPELGEYLRAQRAADANGWQGYLSKFASGAHAAEAKRNLATLFVDAGEAALTAYDKSQASGAPAYSKLKTADAKADQAHAMAPELAATAKLEKEINLRLAAITSLGRGELAAYREALAAHGPGYIHLPNARKFSEIAAEIDPFFSEEQALAEEILKERGAFDSALVSANAAAAVKQFDQAYASILRYRGFAGEEPQVAAIVDGAYGYHIDEGNKLGLSEEWKGAIQEFDKAVSVKDSYEARELKANAQKQLMVSQDKAAAAGAVASSKNYAQQRNMIRAYEVLASLPPAQQALVADEMNALEPAYVESAAQQAKSLHQAHSPIRGLADEVGVERAYDYLRKAYQLSDNESYKDKMDLDGNELSVYLLEQAKHYLGKPGGSGTELGWNYLEEARQYKASNLDAVRDAIVAASPAHAMRSKLSIRVQFRDQTSQRDSQGVAGQLENAIITGLESSGVPVKVVRVGENTAVEPDFELAGDVLSHHLSVVPTIEPQESEYRAGEEQLASEAWNKANRAYESAQEELKTAQAVLEGAEASMKASKIKDAKADVDTAEKKRETAQELLDSTPRTITKDIIRPYTYRKKTIKISGVIQMQFRIGDSLSEPRTDLVPITREDHKVDVLVEDVKPEDTDGIKSAGTVTDPAEFMTTLENSARDELIAAVRKRVEELPMKIYQSASGREKEDDLDEAGESYLRFLNLTREDNSPERQHAKQFLLESFNMRPESVDNP
jgi:hypothetical protein